MEDSNALSREIDRFHDRAGAAEKRRAAQRSGRLWTAYIALHVNAKAFCLLRNGPREEAYVSALASQHPECIGLLHIEIIADDQHEAMVATAGKIHVDEITIRVAK